VDSLKISPIGKTGVWLTRTTYCIWLPSAVTKTIALLYDFIAQNLPDFHQHRLESLEKLKLNTILLRKNPYLFCSKNGNAAGILVRQILDAYLSSQEETYSYSGI